MRKKNDTCTLWPRVDESDPNSPKSTLYVKLIENLNRDLANYVFTMYRMPGVKKAMIDAGYPIRKNHLEHTYKDVYKFFNLGARSAELAKGIQEASREFGIVDSQGNPIEFSAEEAFNRAIEINESGTLAWVADIIERKEPGSEASNKFIIQLYEKTNATQVAAGRLKVRRTTYDAFVQKLDAIGIDTARLTSEFPEYMNPNEMYFLVKFWRSLRNRKPETLSKDDIKFILITSSDMQEVQDILNRPSFAGMTLDDIALSLYDSFHNPNSQYATIRDMAGNVLSKAEKEHWYDITKIGDELYDGDKSVYQTAKRENPSYQMQSKARELSAKYGIDKSIIDITAKKISSLSDVALHSAVVLQKQLDYEIKEKGRTQSAKRVQETLNSLTDCINKKKYYGGLMSTLAEAARAASTANRLLETPVQTGTKEEMLFSQSDLWNRARKLMSAYAPIVFALSEPERLNIDDNISEDDLSLLKQSASEVKNILEKVSTMLNSLQPSIMYDLCVNIFGTETLDEQSVADLMKIAEHDTSFMDYLYACNKVSDPIAGALGTLINDKIVDRNTIVANYTVALSRIENNLREANKKAGREHSHKFMYELVGNRYYIISNIDWDSYHKEYGKAMGKFKEEGYSGVSLKLAMDGWEEENTEQDEFTKERLPKMSLYAKDHDVFQNLTPAEKKYYDDVMAMKKELTEVLPFWAQKIYIPPQKRASWDQLIADAKYKGMSFKETVDLLFDHMTPKFHEDSEWARENGILTDEGTTIRKGVGDYDGYISREIPVYYVKMLSNQNDLSMNFSDAMQRFITTAVNYATMREILGAAELMADWIETKRPVKEKNSNDQTVADIVDTGDSIIVKQLLKRATETNVGNLVRGFVDTHVYGIKLKDGFISKEWAPIMQALINYTSLNNLAPNVKGAIANVLVGEYQMIMESVGKEYYNFIDYLWAQIAMFGDRANVGWVSDHLTNNTKSFAHALELAFDPMNELAEELGGKRYYESAFKKLFGGFNVMGLYGAGESLIHLTNMYAVLHNQKVLLNGKKVSLYKALTTEKVIDGNATLAIKEGATQLDGSPINQAYLDRIKRIINTVNHDCHGGMAAIDKGAIHQRMEGRAVMNFRQWMVGHYSRRFRGRHWDGTQKRMVEGSWDTAWKLTSTFLADYLSFCVDYEVYKKNLDSAQKANVRKVIAEIAGLGILIGINWALPDPGDKKGKWLYRMFIYQARRLLFEAQASIPLFLPNEGVKLLNSPIASVNTVNQILYPLAGLMNGDILEKYSGSRKIYQGWNKYLMKNVRNLPFYKQIEQTFFLDDEDYIFQMFNQ